MPSNFSLPFDPNTEKIYCAYCGKQRQPISHMFSGFMMCPDHGEFTPGPLVVYNARVPAEMVKAMGKDESVADEINKNRDDKWYIHFNDQSEMYSWQTCQTIQEGTRNYVGGHIDLSEET